MRYALKLNENKLEFLKLDSYDPKMINKKLKAGGKQTKSAVVCRVSLTPKNNSFPPFIYSHKDEEQIMHSSCFFYT